MSTSSISLASFLGECEPVSATFTPRENVPPVVEDEELIPQEIKDQAAKYYEELDKLEKDAQQRTIRAFRL